MKDALDLKSKSGIHRLITALEERGFIRRLPNRARALEVIKLPETMQPGIGRARKGFAPSVIDGDGGRKARRRQSPAPSLDSRDTVPVPVMGRIAAGVPIAAIQNQSHILHVPIDLVTGGEHYALEVRGDSMIEAGILDGDTVVYKKVRHRRLRRHHRGAGRRRGSDAEAAPSQGRVGRLGRQPGLRDPHLRAGPRAHPGPPRGADAAVLIQSGRRGAEAPC